MKSFYLGLCALLVLSSCKENTTNPTQETKTATTTSVTKPVKTYPKNVKTILDTHGTMERWNAVRHLGFTLEKEGGDEKHIVDMHSRKTRIETDKWILGFDGEKVWLEQDSTYYQPERARFYHNLMFYFYAMPFVLADDGITYSNADPLEFEGVSYPGTKISFGPSVGDAPDDEYIIYRDPNSNMMAWLAYTVTYGKNEKSDRFSYIKYNEWQKTAEGFAIPRKIQWYKMKDGVPTEMAAERSFIFPVTETKPLDQTIFEKPVNGTFAE